MKTLWLALALLGAAAVAAAPALEQLKSASGPVFRPGHTLLPLSVWGPEIPLATRVELAERWGYCLYFGRLRPELVAELQDPQSTTARLCALSKSNPARYPLQVIVAPDWGLLTYADKLPEATWTHDAEGKRAGEGKVWSPEAPDVVFETIADYEAGMLREVLKRAPIAIVTNGGEYAMPSTGHSQKYWEQDPAIQKARGDKDWWDYVSERKAHQEMIVTRRLQAVVPARKLYIYYYTQACTFRNRWPGWKNWCWDYKQIRHVSDIPNAESYWHAGTDNWLGQYDMLTHALNAVTQQTALGDHWTYNWVCPGWSFKDAKEPAISDPARYLGYLKCYYTAGMTGGVAGYFGYDSEDNWIWQLMALGQVQALFSHLEPFVRASDILPGPGRHEWSTEFPACEFPTGSKDVRVLARKHRQRSEWLITAWAANGRRQSVTVEIPALGQATLEARGTGAVYHAAFKDGKPSLTLIDKHGDAPTQGMSADWCLK